MKNISTVIAKVIVSLMTVVLITTPAMAMGFTVRPQLPENQRPGGSGFFDLLVTPGQRQEITITVVNTADTETAVTVEAFTVATNRNGIVAYSGRGENDVTLVHDLADIITVSTPEVTIPAGAERDVTLTIQVPDEGFDGVLLGSVFVLQGVTDEERESDSMILNQFAFATAIMLDAGRPVEPDFAMGEVSAQLLDWRSAIVAEIRNIQPLLAKEVKTRAQIFPVGSSDAIFDHTVQADFAPNSIFPFPLYDEAGYGIQPGRYTAIINLEYQGQTWEFEREFEILPTEAAEINEQSISPMQQAPAVNQGLPTWVIIAIVGGAVLLILIVVSMFLRQKKQAAQYQELLNQIRTQNAPKEEPKEE